ncbi:PQQ-dependent sugar dehydrogenase [Iamia majanohamensis]|uniref:PQQ-dependent sugar dehydrogenase n=1 Tax=Iamia majanohamensis TaxID=467976 RepID=A0AAF0BUZ1_9ACTN|nr:PQQ-dependent sugar dehydrogenase [Iamia majanohamensis]WCO65889.1 PQQ-dependent sugar dehydrogenase [Iamia majanohamensis]
MAWPRGPQPPCRRSGGRPRRPRRTARGLLGPLAAVLLLVVAACGDDEAGSDDPDGAPGLEEVASLGSIVTGVALDEGAGQLYLTERDGRVQRLAVDDEDGGPTEVLDVAAETTTDGERGLLGLALDGSEAVFLMSTGEGGDILVDRYARDGDDLAADSRTTLLRIGDRTPGHNGGGLALAPDGSALFVGVGDAATIGPGTPFAQDPTLLAGVVLRLDLASATPEPEVVARGLRNPWRLSFDPGSGDLWIFDVGETSREEVDRIPAGDLASPPDPPLNFGWPYREGRIEGPVEAPEDVVPLLDPEHEWEHRPGRCGVAGGGTYGGTDLPALTGMLVTGDLCSSEVLALDPDDPDAEPEAVASADAVLVAVQVVSDGEVYATTQTGEVLRLVPGAPTAEVAVTAVPAEAPSPPAPDDDGDAGPEATPGCRTGQELVRLNETFVLDPPPEEVATQADAVLVALAAESADPPPEIADELAVVARDLPPILEQAATLGWDLDDPRVEGLITRVQRGTGDDAALLDAITTVVQFSLAECPGGDR